MSPLRVLLFIGLLTTVFALRIAPRKCYPLRTYDIFSEKRKCEKCLLAYRCSPYYSDGVLWALADGVCEVFANGCMMGSYECGRINACKSKLIRSDREECQKCCASGCEKGPKDPHYGWVYELSADGTNAGNGYCKQFGNECEAKKWACENGIPLTGISQGNCS